MVKIKQVGIGRMASGTIDGITYVTRGDVTFARSTPTMPAHVYTTPAAKKRRAIFNPNQSLGPISSCDVKVFSCSPESKECLPLIHGSHKT